MKAMKAVRERVTMAGYKLDHTKKTVQITKKKLTHIEDVEVADFAAKGYKVKEYQPKNKAAYLSKMPNDEAKEAFNKVFEENGGKIAGLQAAVKWAKEQGHIK